MNNGLLELPISWQKASELSDYNYFIMSSQWDYFLNNIGTWQGSFTHLDAKGIELKDTPTIVTFEATHNNQTVHQIVNYLPQDQPASKVEVDYAPTSLSRDLIFFPNGSFCRGNTQWNGYSNFVSEFGLIAGDRRLRTVNIYNNSINLNRIVLIREKLPDSNTPERPQLTVEDLLGEWQGEAMTIFPDSSEPKISKTHLKIKQKDQNHIEQQLSFGNRKITSTAKLLGSRLLFENSNLSVQILLLPDGCSCNCPLEIKSGHGFVLELGWLLQPNKRQRIMRNFDQHGTWINSTFVTEMKI
ncbi:protein of unknown function (DUF3598) [Xenococcus sp. PCC 7305]|uniref:DUF3598 family protein n=1 Tax=Xenococcus sp. PCC 7305 TaxID=102125 RepID=UPI0002ABA087|nr:DUF3598 family protein [Xenococcus sp. PCC 7305]ELS00828.1 protein of unknown function (DUF3598) [Xenococcus sp. PCC 7305]